MSLNYVPKDYNPRLTATQEQIDACNEKMLFTRVQFGTEARPDVGDVRKNKWFDQCLKHKQQVSSLAGPEAKVVWEREQEEIKQAKTAGFGNIPKVVWIVIGAGVLYFVAKKQKWIK